MRGCAEVTSLLPAFVGLDLPPAEESEVREHLRGCAACRDRYAEAEPTLAFSLALAVAPAREDDLFVPGVLAGIRQRRVERQARSHRRWWMGAAAAVVLAVLGSTATYYRLQGGPTTPPAIVAEGPAQMGPALVEVDGDGVRLYQLTVPGRDASEVQVAFIVNPQLEL
ncbi:MAG TPA: zf-HC2 domain-containing protein [Thermoanaerobaculaceae bacterium]|nr:zf-HC2 domain-containing protein [Thermoanaerobaculaceae bacterium]HPS77248.1 zf-HC2 domain-containing protein [Thermoanaerobaculaceae bacterium]